MRNRPSRYRQTSSRIAILGLVIVLLLSGIAGAAAGPKGCKSVMTFASGAGTSSPPCCCCCQGTQAKQSYEANPCSGFNGDCTSPSEKTDVSTVPTTVELKVFSHTDVSMVPARAEITPVFAGSSHRMRDVYLTNLNLLC
jgi:hypothetical protein